MKHENSMLCKQYLDREAYRAFYTGEEEGTAGWYELWFPQGFTAQNDDLTPEEIVEFFGGDWHVLEAADGLWTGETPEPDELPDEAFPLTVVYF